jgi:methyltransferase (TIGR00027 family)
MKENQASSTAFTVLQGILHIAKSTEHDYLVSDDVISAGELILSASDEGQKRLKELRSPLSKISTKLREYFILPGITVHYVLRKRYIEDQTRQAIANGVTQIVNLGAGFDSLAWRLHDKHSQVNFIEIDHPDTHKLKVAALVPSKQDKRENMHFLSVDFTQQDMKSALENFAEFDATRPTLYICEGVMMYLLPAEIEGIFSAIHALTGPGSLMLFTSLEPQHSNKNNVRSLLFSYLKFIGEPLKWELEHHKMADFLKDKNCQLQEMADTTELKQRYVTKPTDYKFHHGEYLVQCVFDSNA